jgi:SAM-dependent methyltransferase
MKYEPTLGIFDLSIPWVPTPAHIVRRSALLDILGAMQPGRVLEMGCGSGAFLHDLARQGYHGVGVDTSERAAATSSRFWPAESGAFVVRRSLDGIAPGTFDYVMAFEVLEHIERHDQALREWAGYLVQAGRLVISIPAHRAKFGESDRWAGHCRRYDQHDVIDLLEDCGFTVERLISYGFPLLNLLAPFSNFSAARKSRARERKATHSPTQATALSGVDRTFESKAFPLYGNALGRSIFRAACSIQRRFYATERGTGWIVVGCLKGVA